MWPDRVSKPGPLAVESDGLSTVPVGPTGNVWDTYASNFNGPRALS